MQRSRQGGTISRRGVVRVNAGPLRDAKIELGIVALLLFAALMLTFGLDGPPWAETAALLGISAAGAVWVALRARHLARRAVAGESGRPGDGGPDRAP